MELNDEIIKNFQLGKVFKPASGGAEDAQINSISFHRTHDLLVSASNDDSIKIYNTQEGEESNAYWSKKYGVANISFTHDPASVIYSSTKHNHDWRYHDLHTNKYVRYFSGHLGRVTALMQSPKTDQVLSAAEDKQVRLWDLRNGICNAVLYAPGLPTVAWDEQGLVFCVGAESGVVKLYDARNYSAGPFAAFTVTGERNSNAVFAVLRFSLDGKYLLGVVEGRIYVLDAFTGETLRFVSSGIPEGGMALEACLTADGRYILSGCWDRYIRAWSVETGNVVGQWQQHADIPTCLKFSPRKMMVASACQALCFWIPGEAAISAARQRQHVSATIHAPAIQQWHQPGMRMV